ncbi:MAG: hypothetical protein LBG80_19820 [Bacteroidales bacterium]|nr:hypothetical protein [Bacteroidales bacterium]
MHDPNTWLDTFGLNEINEIGQTGEQNAGITKNTKKIDSASGKRKYRIPDGMSEDGKHLTEVKNVNKQYFSSQLKDDLAYIQKQKGGSLTLIVDTRTKLTPQLQAEVDANRIILERKDLNGTC